MESEEFQRLFVENEMFRSSSTRRIIYNNLMEVIEDFRRKGFYSNITKIWVDGSFITNKNNPDDIDILFFYDVNDELAELNKNFDQYFDLYRFKMRTQKYCHINKIMDIETLSEEYRTAELVRSHSINMAQWQHDFMIDKKFNRKGLVEIINIEERSRLYEQQV